MEWKNTVDVLQLSLINAKLQQIKTMIKVSVSLCLYETSRSIHSREEKI